MSNANQPAMAYAEFDAEGNVIVSHLGLTKREDFAKAAMQGLLAGGFNFYADDIGDLAVDITDKVLDALEANND